MGIGLGLNNVIIAAYVGFGLHLLTGSALGGSTWSYWDQMEKNQDA